MESILYLSKVGLLKGWVQGPCLCWHIRGPHLELWLCDYQCYSLEPGLLSQDKIHMATAFFGCCKLSSNELPFASVWTSLYLLTTIGGNSIFLVVHVSASESVLMPFLYMDIVYQDILLGLSLWHIQNPTTSYGCLCWCSLLSHLGYHITGLTLPTQVPFSTQ